MTLLKLIDHVMGALENWKCAVGIFLDFGKAFATADHRNLLDNFYCYGIRGTTQNGL